MTLNEFIVKYPNWILEVSFRADLVSHRFRAIKTLPLKGDIMIVEYFISCRRLQQSKCPESLTTSALRSLDRKIKKYENN